jgi:DNA topoisomerase-3
MLNIRADRKASKSHIAVGDYAITWGYGHMVEIATEEIGGGRGKFPVFPEIWKYNPVKDQFSKSQLAAASKLIRSASEIIIATDCGREGELIARLVIEHATSKKVPMQRFWTSESLEPEVVEKTMKNLRPSSEFDSLHMEALSRQHADWLVGINLSRALKRYSAATGSISVGRVQTPVLSVLVERELEIQNFKGEAFWQMRGDFGNSDASYQGLWSRTQTASSSPDEDDSEDGPKTRLSKVEASVLEKKLFSAKLATITEVKKTKKKEQPPLLHTITTMQIKANKKYGYSSAETAKILQSLYETHKVCSYPRTESKYLGTGNTELVKNILMSLGRSDLAANVTATNKRIFNDAKLTDHHALIPMKKANLKSLSKEEQNIYNELVMSLTAAFYPDAEVENFKIVTEVEGETFESQGTADLSLGWKEVFGYKEKKFSFDLKKGTVVDILKLDLQEKETKPPSRYTEATLLRVMENAHLLIPKDRKDLRAIMKTKENAGLGTGATRAGIIEGLKSKAKQYVTMQNKFLVPTAKGIEMLRELMGKTSVTNALLTAELEESLKKVREHELTYETFIKGVQTIVIDEINVLKTLNLKALQSVAQATHANVPSKIGNCGTCKTALNDFGKGVSCQTCGIVVWRMISGKKLSDSAIKKLISGQPVYVEGLVSKKKTKFNTWLVLNKETKKIDFDFSIPPPASKPKNSPVAKKSGTTLASQKVPGNKPKTRSRL